MLTTKKFATLLIIIFATVGILFGAVPKMLNANSTLLNSLGIAVVVTVVFGVSVALYKLFEEDL